jgi:lysophospholipase
MNWVREENYEETMKTVVEPFVTSCMESGYFHRLPEENIYYEHFKNTDPKGVIVICHGFTESIKKFYESVYYMLQEGYEVWGLDHRGHGRSLRENDNPYVVHVEHFTDYERDFKYYVEDIVKPSSEGLPVYLYCHSMGGCIGAEIIEDNPYLFDKAVLSSPMLGLNFGRIPVPVVYAAASIIGIGERRKNPFGSDGTFNPEPDFENCACSSECRYNYYFKKTLEDPFIQTCSPSIQWGKQAARACRYVMSKADLIRIPVLLIQAGEDTLVKNSAEDLFCEWVEGCEKYVVPGMKHELYRTDSPVLIPYWEKIFGFLEK